MCVCVCASIVCIVPCIKYVGTEQKWSNTVHRFSVDLDVCTLKWVVNMELFP